MSDIVTSLIRKSFSTLSFNFLSFSIAFGVSFITISIRVVIVQKIIH